MDKSSFETVPAQAYPEVVDREVAMISNDKWILMLTTGTTLFVVVCLLNYFEVPHGPLVSALIAVPCGFLGTVAQKAYLRRQACKIQIG